MGVHQNPDRRRDGDHDESEGDAKAQGVTEQPPFVLAFSGNIALQHFRQTEVREVPGERDERLDQDEDAERTRAEVGGHQSNGKRTENTDDEYRAESGADRVQNLSRRVVIRCFWRAHARLSEPFVSFRKISA